MYTEDDEDVKVKKKNSEDDYNDFYTSFSEMDEDESKKEKKKSKKKEEPEEKDEEDYKDFYGNEEEEKVEVKEDNYKKTVIKIGIIVILALLLVDLLFILFRKTEPGDIELSKTEYTLEFGQKDYISYKIVDTDKAINPSFNSNNPTVATVDENGEIIAVSKGESIITISYKIFKIIGFNTITKSNNKHKNSY